MIANLLYFNIINNNQNINIFIFGKLLFVCFTNANFSNGQIVFNFPESIKIKQETTFAVAGESGIGEIAITKKYVKCYGNGSSLSGIGIAILE